MTRLDAFLARNHGDLSRATLQKLIKEGYVTLNGKVITKPSHLVDNPDEATVSIDLSPLEQPATNDLELDVLYEDEECVVVNKPVGVLSHSKGVFNPEDTLASWLARRAYFNFPEEKKTERSGIVHRLDRATSGVIICSKNPQALGFLQKQFQERTVKKTYVAKVAGILETEEAIIDLPIGRNPKKPQTFRVDAKGKEAVTHYRVIQENNDNTSLVELKPMTGRTHQLRVHLAYLKAPIIGDAFYGTKKGDRLYLHASELEITIPGGVRKVFTAPVPKGFID